MAMTPRLIMGYLHHARAVGAVERLEAIYDANLPHAKPADQRRELERLRRAADGETLTPEQELAARQAGWDASWNALRGRLPSVAKLTGQPNAHPGERVVIPADL